MGVFNVVTLGGFIVILSVFKVTMVTLGGNKVMFGCHGYIKQSTLHTPKLPPPPLNRPPLSNETSFTSVKGLVTEYRPPLLTRLTFSSPVINDHSLRTELNPEFLIFGLER